VAEPVSAAGLVKLVILPRTLAGLGRAGLRRHLETVHGPMVVAAADVSGRFVTYVHHYAQDLPASAGATVLDDRDAITVIRFRSMADLAASKASAAYRESVGPDENNFRELDGSVALIARELEVVPGLDNGSRKLFIFRTKAATSPHDWAETLSGLAHELQALGAVTNDARVVEGVFPYVQFDEIGLPDGADPSLFVARLTAAAASHFGDCSTACVFTQPVRFI
jgi:hypothetical protein